MPSGRSGGSRSFGGGGHFGRSSSGSFGGGHFGRSSSRSSSIGGHFGRSGSSASRPSLHWRPHTTVVFGRRVYYGAGRAKASSLLSILLFYVILGAFILGFFWMDAKDDVSLICENYPYYLNMIEHAEKNDLFTYKTAVTGYEEYKDTGKYMIYYEFNDGYSFYFYTKEQAIKLYNDGYVTLAIDCSRPNINEYTDSIPMDHKEILAAGNLSEDVQYVDCVAKRNGLLAGTIIVAGLAVAMIIAKVAISLTAKKATAEQVAESSGTKSTSVNGWRCEYCNSLNDATKTTCDGCGASRQK